MLSIWAISTMILNKKQKTLLVVFPIAILLIFVFPPYFIKGKGHIQSAYSCIFKNPPLLKLDTGMIFAEMTGLTLVTIAFFLLFKETPDFSFKRKRDRELRSAKNRKRHEHQKAEEASLLASEGKRETEEREKYWPENPPY